MPPRISRSSNKRRCRRWPSRPPPSKPQRRLPPHPRLLPPLRPRTTSPQLEQLATLKEQGVLSDEEFAAAKAKLLGG